MEIHFTMTVDFKSSKAIEDSQLMHSNSDTIEIMIINDTHKIIDEVFEILCSSNQIGLESMKCNEFVFDFVDGLHFKCDKISLNCGGSHIDSSGWLNNKKATLNPKNL